MSNPVVDAAVIAHRGASQFAPENTIEALVEARNRGATWVEVDIALTADNQLVLMHDDSIDRTTNGQGFVYETNFSELRKLDAGSWMTGAPSAIRVPTLAECIESVISLEMSIQFEFKPSLGNDIPLAELSCQALSELWPSDASVDYFVSSFSLDCLDVAARLLPDVPRAVALMDIPEHPRMVAEEADAQVIHIFDTGQPIAAYERVAASGVECGVAVVNDPERGRALLDAGCQSLVTDDPALLD